MKIYTTSVENGCVEALLLIEAKEAAHWQDVETAVNAAIARFAKEKDLGLLLFPRVLDLDEQEDGAILLRFEAAVKPDIHLGEYKGLHTGVPRADEERFAAAALNAATENTPMTVPALIVERRLEQMLLQRRSDVLQSVSYNTLADVYEILKSCNEELDIPQSPESIWAMAVDAAAKLSRGEVARSADGLMSLLAERLYGDGLGEKGLRAMADALDRRLRQKQETDAETAADELFRLYLRTRNQSMEDWQEEHRAMAAELTRTELMLDAVAEQESLTVSREELERELAILSAQYGITAEEVLNLTGEENLRFQLLRAKARALILESAEE